MAVATGILSYYDKSNYSLIAHTGALYTAGGYTVVTTPLNLISTPATLIVVSVFYASGASSYTFADSQSNVWIPFIAYPNLYYCINPSVSSSQTFTVTSIGGPVFPTICVQAFAGGVVSHTDKFLNGNGVASPPIPNTLTYTLTPSYSNEIIVTSFGGFWESANATINSSFIITDQIIDPAFNLRHAMAYFIQGNAATISPAWTYTWQGSNLGAGYTSLISFK